MTGLRINGQLQYVYDIQQFIDLVEKYMGDDSAKYLEQYVIDTELEIKNQNEKIGEILQEE